MKKTRGNGACRTDDEQRLKYGMTISEIADAINKTPEYVNLVLWRAMKKIKRHRRVLAEYL